jgi:hypothetical protein
MYAGALVGGVSGLKMEFAAQHHRCVAIGYLQTTFMNGSTAARPWTQITAKHSAAVIIH